MAQQDPAQRSSPTGDPWNAFGYLVAGVAFYGLLGWLVDLWLGTSYVVGIGILAGASLGIYMTWARFRIEPTSPDSRVSKKNATNQESQ